MTPFLADLVARFEELEAELNALDSATGDGDHGTTMLKGLRAALANPDNPARAFRNAAGGASGTLFSVLVGALHKVESGSGGLGAELTRAAGQIGQLGGAGPGDKTMLDALIPAAQAGQGSLEAAAAAEAGLAATLDMRARRGRARYVEGAGEGHLDAGARSVVELLRAHADREESR